MYNISIRVGGLTLMCTLVSCWGEGKPGERVHFKLTLKNVFFLRPVKQKFTVIYGGTAPLDLKFEDCVFSQKIKQLRKRYQKDLIINVPRNSKTSFISVETMILKLL